MQNKMKCDQLKAYKYASIFGANYAYVIYCIPCELLSKYEYLNTFFFTAGLRNRKVGFRSGPYSNQGAGNCHKCPFF